MNVKLIGWDIRRITTFEPHKRLVFEITPNRLNNTIKTIHYWVEDNVVQKRVSYEKVSESRTYPISK